MGYDFLYGIKRSSAVCEKRMLYFQLNRTADVKSARFKLLEHVSHNSRGAVFYRKNAELSVAGLYRADNVPERLHKLYVG